MPDDIFHWKTFHHFNPYKDDEDARAAKLAESWKWERKVLKAMGRRAQEPEVKKRTVEHTSLTRRSKKIPVTLPSMKWGNDGTDS